MIKTTIICDRCGVEWEEPERTTSSEWLWSRGETTRHLNFCQDCAPLYRNFLRDIQELEEGMIQQFLNMIPDAHIL